MTECSITVWPVPREPPSPDQQCRPRGGRPGHSWAASSAHTESHSDYQGQLPYVQEGKETIIPCSTGKRVTKTYFHWGRWCRMESSQLEQKLWSIRWRTWISWGNQVSEVCIEPAWSLTLHWEDPLSHIWERSQSDPGEVQGLPPPSSWAAFSVLRSFSMGVWTEKRRREFFLTPTLYLTQILILWE